MGECWTCGGKDHMANNCPKKGMRNSTGRTLEPNVRKLEIQEQGKETGNNIEKETQEEMAKNLESDQGTSTQQYGIHTPCLLEGQQLIAFVDGGASNSLISAELVKTRG